MNTHAGILIVGSLNMDLVVKVDDLPQSGETVAGGEFKMLPGGKGANQAYAAGRLSKLGQSVRMIGCVGRDTYGEQLRASLESVGVKTDCVRTEEHAPTGVALITVEQSGQNQIVVVSGANHCLRPGEVLAAIAALDAGFLLLQLESPMKTVEAAAQAGKAGGMTVILDPAPARPIGSSLLKNVDILTPNESEALALLELGGDEIDLARASGIARRLMALGPRRVVLKLGAKGVWLADEKHDRHFPARRVEAVDVTAAGDCFNGALAVALAEGRETGDAILFANSAAAIAVTRFGAQISIPSRAEVDAWLSPSAGAPEDFQ